MSRAIYLALATCSLVTLAGCGGPKLVPVEGVVMLDGKPVEGATVTFVSDDGKYSFSGSTDSSGHFALQEGEKLGAFPGTYKVTVVKGQRKPGGESIDPEEGMKMMKKDAEEAEKANKADKAKQAASGDMKSKMASMVGAKSSPGAPPATVKSELPSVYAIGTKTPLTATVPAAGPIQLDLKSKP
jgi:hypothetical protein